MEISFFSTAPNELNYALPWLLKGQIKNNFQILSIQTRRDCLGQKNHLTLMSLESFTCNVDKMDRWV
jgi:hypothetical protein